MTNIEKNHESEQASKEPEYGKAFLKSGLSGSVFGLVFALFFLQITTIPWPPAFFAAGITLFAGLFSGFAGFGATYLDQALLRWGVAKLSLRFLISYCLVAGVTFLLAYFGARTIGLVPEPEIQRYVVWGTLSGLAFGAAVALTSYLTNKVRQRVLLLEMENRHLAELANREELLREAARSLAVAEERTRMARELHDSISQGMHGIVYSLRSLRKLLGDNQRGLEILGHLDQTASETLKELRHLVEELSPSIIEDQGLAEALRLHCDLFARRQQLELELQLGYAGGLQPDQEVALYRITQEALSNIQKHAGASHVDVSLQGGSQAQLIIWDNGRGFNPADAVAGHGLANMTARARQSGGNLELSSCPGGGTTIIVNFQEQ